MYKLSIIFFLLTTTPVFAKKLIISSDVINPYYGMSIGPSSNGKGQTVYIDTNRWDLNTIGDNQIFTDKTSTIGTKIIFNFDINRDVASVARVNEFEINYETDTKRVYCKFGGPSLHHCTVFSTNNCEEVNKIFQKEFQGDFKKMESCNSKLSSLGAFTSQKENSLEYSDKNFISKIKDLSNDPRILKNMRLGLAEIENKPYSSLYDVTNHGSDAVRSGSHIFQLLKLCEDRGFLGEDKLPSANENIKTQDKKTVTK